MPKSKPEKSSCRGRTTCMGAVSEAALIAANPDAMYLQSEQPIGYITNPLSPYIAAFPSLTKGIHCHKSPNNTPFDCYGNRLY